jgi:hypothetical protein
VNLTVFLLVLESSLLFREQDILCFEEERMFFFSHGVRLSPFGTVATVWPIVPVPDDR